MKKKKPINLSDLNGPDLKLSPMIRFDLTKMSSFFRTLFSFSNSKTTESIINNRDIVN